MELTQHPPDAVRRAGHQCPVLRRWHQRGLYCFVNGPVTTVSSPPSEAGLSSACSNHADLLVTSLSCRISCGLVQIQVILWVTKHPPSVDSWVLEFDWWTSFSLDVLSLYIAASGLQKDCWVCLHFNKYSIKMLWCVWIAWLLGDPSTSNASWVAGSLLFIVLFLLVGIDPRLPAQGQCALSSIHPCGLKDLKKEGKNYAEFMDANYAYKQTPLFLSSFPSLNNM